jgi:4-amino-4-deoxy-L-arabinose transferase-like glycosyltransferase
MSVRVYEGVADVFLYFSSGLRLLNKFSLTGDWTFLRPFWGTNFIIMLTGWLAFLFGPAFQALMIIFATLSYCGQYLFYRAFCIAFPTRPHKTAALFMFFLPSIVFWTSTIGKDAVIFFFIGSCCYGYAKMARRADPVGLVTVLISLGGVMLVRPPIAGMLAISLSGAYFFSRNRRGLGGMAIKILGVPLLLLASVYFVAQARTFLDMTDIGQTAGILRRVAKNNQIGGSAFGSSLTYRLAAAPFLLFRPFLWEVRSPQAAIAGIEALGLMIFTWRRRDRVRSSFRSWRDSGFVLFCWVYTLEFSLMFAGAMTNFGLLARQRVMLIPLALTIVLSQPLPSVGCLRIRR